MKRSVRSSLFLSMALSGGLAAMLALLILLGTVQTPAALADPGAVFYVAPDGNCGSASPCYASVQAAVDAAAPGDVIKVAAGTYTGVSGRPRSDIQKTGTVTQVVYISKTVTIRGGYTADYQEPPSASANATELDAKEQGRVLYITGNISPTINGLRIRGGDATGLGGGTGQKDAGGGIYIYRARATLRLLGISGNSADQGGAIYLYNSPTIVVGSTILANSANQGAGLYALGDDPTVTNAVIALNTAADKGGGLYLHLNGENAAVTSSIIYSNTAADGGGAYVASSSVTIRANQVLSNTATDSGGGLYLMLSEATIQGNLIRANQAFTSGGGLDLYRSIAQVSANRIVHNTAGQRGGGANILVVSDSPTLVNNVVAANQADNRGSGLYISGISSQTVRLSYTTIASNQGGDGSGIYLAGPIAVLSNTIVASQTVGLYAGFGSTANLEATLWGSGDWANGQDTSGIGNVSMGSINVTGNPGFIDPAHDNYHIGSGSAAIDRGIDIGVTMDIDGDPRPSGVAPDLGADEYVNAITPTEKLYLPLITAAS